MNRTRLPARVAALTVGVATLAAGLPGLASAAPARASRAAEPAAITVQALVPPRGMRADDGRVHLDYNLAVTNILPEEVTLTSAVVRTGGKPILNLRGDELADHTRQALGTDPSATLPQSSTRILQIDALLPRSSKGELPWRVSNHISYALQPGSALSVFVGATTVDAPRLKVDRRKATVVEPPLRGSGWYGLNACCDPAAAHRATVFSANGTYESIEMFAIDWLRIVDGAYFSGDGTQLTDHFSFGAKVHAAAPGKVVSVREDFPEAPVTDSSIGNPTVTEPSQLAGNHAVVKIAPGRYAVYGHMQPGSVRVKPGQHVRAGPTIGLLGNSGNSSAPHLHFGIQAGPNVTASDSLPFVFDRFRFEGFGTFASETEFTLSGTPGVFKRAYPLASSVIDLSP
ncbi:MAG: peptidoglycan DD-metalloendopeptidase family protein [Solirubrobacterales bacterium]|nr:peptidoglycan DD-metalloendopeptidase family protein [Solirubrobacterales bacterium]